MSKPLQPRRDQVQALRHRTRRSRQLSASVSSVACPLPERHAIKEPRALLPSNWRDADRGDSLSKHAEFACRFYREIDDPVPRGHTVIYLNDDRATVLQGRHARLSSDMERWRCRQKRVVHHRLSSTSSLEMRPSLIPRRSTYDGRSNRYRLQNNWGQTRLFRRQRGLATLSPGRARAARGQCHDHRHQHGDWTNSRRTHF